MLVANAAGRSSAYGGNLPTTPWAADGSGRGPAWTHSLFEDNAEFGQQISVGRRRWPCQMASLMCCPFLCARPGSPSSSNVPMSCGSGCAAF